MENDLINTTVIPWNGQKITRPGVYSDIPLDTYHGDICDGPSISSSGLRLIESRSLLHYFDQSYLNPDRAPPVQKTFFNLGKAVHHVCGGEVEFKKCFSVRPDKWDSWRTDAAKQWRALQYLDGKGVLEPDDMLIIKGVADQLGAHPAVQAGIMNGLAEHSIFWKRTFMMPDGGRQTVWVKSRPDIIPLQANMIVDLKTTTDASPVAVRRKIADLEYHMQLGLGHDGLKRVWGRVMEEHVLVFAETERPFAINVKPIDYVDVEYGMRQCERALFKFAHAVYTGQWLGFDDDEMTAKLPQWYRERLAAQAENGLLPTLPKDPDPEPEDTEAF